MDKKEHISYFLASNSSKGFYSLFDELYDAHSGWKMYVIKGGPGTGKSGFMKKIAQYAEERGYYCEYVYCSSDPDSLDAVIIPELKVSLADGTAPHVIEPKYPGVCETIINLGQFWDEKILNINSEHIITLIDCNKALHKQSSRYMTAVGAALNENIKITQASALNEKIDNFVTRFTAVNLSCNNSYGKEKRRFISAVTPKGKICLTESLPQLCDKIITVSDEFGCIAGIIMSKLRQSALANGISVITCMNPYIPQSYPEHLIFEKERIGVFTADSSNKIKSIADKNINYTRFVDKSIYSAHKNRMALNKKTADEFIAEAVNVLAKAKSVHDEIESYYISAMDFEKVNIQAHILAEKIFNT